MFLVVSLLAIQLRTSFLRSWYQDKILKGGRVVNESGALSTVGECFSITGGAVFVASRPRRNSRSSSLKSVNILPLHCFVCMSMMQTVMRKKLNEINRSLLRRWLRLVRKNRLRILLPVFKS